MVVGDLGSGDGCDILAEEALVHNSLAAVERSSRRSCCCSALVVEPRLGRHIRPADCIAPTHIVVIDCTDRSAANSVFRSRCSLDLVAEDSTTRMRLGETGCSRWRGSVDGMDRLGLVSDSTLAKAAGERVCYVDRLVAEEERWSWSSSSEQLAQARRG